MAFRTLSQRVSEARALAAGDAIPDTEAETHRISNPRQRDIDRAAQKIDDDEAQQQAKLKQNKVAAAHVTSQIQQSLPGTSPPDYSAARENVARLIKESAAPSRPPRSKLPSNFAKQVNAMTRPNR